MSTLLKKRSVSKGAWLAQGPLIFLKGDLKTWAEQCMWGWRVIVMLSESDFISMQMNVKHLTLKLGAQSDHKAHKS